MARPEILLREVTFAEALRADSMMRSSTLDHGSPLPTDLQLSPRLAMAARPGRLELTRWRERPGR